MSEIPGIIAVHAIITPECRKNRTPLGAIMEACDRVAKEYVECIGIRENEAAKYHLVLTVERDSSHVSS